MSGAWYGHTIEERADAVRQMALDWDALYQNLASQVGELTPDPTSPSGYHVTTQAEFAAHPPDPAKVAWWKSNAYPLIKQWVKFRQEQIVTHGTAREDYIAWAERAWTSWGTYEDWKKKLEALRAEAQKRGFTITASAPTALPTTIWEDVAHTVERGAGAVAGGVGDVWKLVKYGAWAVLGIGAIVALSSVASNLRSGKDPAEKYVTLIKPRSFRELPSSPRLALPAGELVEEAA